MSQIVITKRRKLNNPGANGCILKVSRAYFATLDEEWKEHPINVGKLMAKIRYGKIKIGGIEIYDENGRNGKLDSFIQIEPASKDKFIISMFTNGKENADFSISMGIAINPKTDRKGICFKDYAKELDRRSFCNIDNFVLSMFWYITYKNIDTKHSEYYWIEPEDDLVAAWEQYRNS